MKDDRISPLSYEFKSNVKEAHEFIKALLSVNMHMAQEFRGLPPDIIDKILSYIKYKDLPTGAAPGTVTQAVVPLHFDFRGVSDAMMRMVNTFFN